MGTVLTFARMGKKVVPEIFVLGGGDKAFQEVEDTKSGKEPEDEVATGVAYGEENERGEDEITDSVKHEHVSPP